jgi:biofilm PGA synthesis N-glycosyltransferase PgaC
MTTAAPIAYTGLPDAREFAARVPRPSAPVSPALSDRRGLYFPLVLKFVIALTIAIAWCGLSVWMSQPWLHDLADVTGWPLAIFVIMFIAYVPGFMNSFLISTVLLDRRPERRLLDRYPDITILVACYNEADNVTDTIRSLAMQQYPGRMDVLILDDGSEDGTVEAAHAAIAAAELQAGHAFRIIEGVTMSVRRACATEGFPMHRGQRAWRRRRLPDRSMATAGFSRPHSPIPIRRSATATTTGS